MDTDDDMEIEEIQREEQWEMVQAELQSLYYLPPAARMELLQQQPWFRDLPSGDKEYYQSIIEEISYEYADANAVADTNADADVNADADADTDDAVKTGYTSNELNFNEDNAQLNETSVSVHEEINATNNSSSASPDKIYAVKTNDMSTNALRFCSCLLLWEL
jgi:hypothetical protein